MQLYVLIHNVYSCSLQVLDVREMSQAQAKAANLLLERKNQPVRWHKESVKHRPVESTDFADFLFAV